jgi:hypothetical protein
MNNFNNGGYELNPFQVNIRMTNDHNNNVYEQNGYGQIGNGSNVSSQNFHNGLFVLNGYAQNGSVQNGNGQFCIGQNGYAQNGYSQNGNSQIVNPQTACSQRQEIMSESNKVLENLSLNSPLREKRNSSNGKSSASKKIKSSENFYIEDSVSRAKCKYGREDTIFRKVANVFS